MRGKPWEDIPVPVSINNLPAVCEELVSSKKYSMANSAQALTRFNRPCKVLLWLPECTTLRSR
jgi:hypothetical protein